MSNIRLHYAFCCKTTKGFPTYINDSLHDQHLKREGQINNALGISGMPYSKDEAALHGRSILARLRYGFGHMRSVSSLEPNGSEV
jgi:hypothetical protein